MQKALKRGEEDAKLIYSLSINNPYSSMDYANTSVAVPPLSSNDDIFLFTLLERKKEHTLLGDIINCGGEGC